jgi:hypothetical protein
MRGARWWVGRGDATPPSGTAEPIRNSHRPASNFGITVERKHEENTKPREKNVAAAAPPKGGDGDAAAALPHALAPMRAQCVYCCGGAEESKGFGGEQEKAGDATAVFPNAVAPVGAPSV